MGNGYRDIRQSALETLLRFWARTVSRNFEQRDPFAVQSSILSHLVRRGRPTRFGRDYGFSELARMPFEKLYATYRQRVPIRTYDDFWRDYFASGYITTEGRKLLNLTDVTWPGKIPFFCETSGTTAPSKFIPFTHEMHAANKRAAMELAACYLHRNRSSRLPRGKLLYMAGNTSLSDMGNGVLSGDMSAITLVYPPSYLKSFIEPTPAVSALPWEEKLTAMARLLLTDREIRAISGVPPWVLLLLKRCAELGGGSVRGLLPDLELIIHGGTSMKPYRAEFAEILDGASPQFLELLPSSEAFMAFQLTGEEYMRLTPYYGVFFEFVPFTELDERGVPAPDARAVPLEEIRAGIRYAVILSTCAGLWRYHIGDTVRFVSVDPLMIEFTGRDKFLDRFEEKVTQGEVEEAVSRLNRLNGAEIREFVVGPYISDRRHLWILAMGGERKFGDNRLAENLDRSLQTMNADYATFRSQGRIREPFVVTVSEELIYRWSKDVRGKLGGQSKIPHIDPTMNGELVQSLLSYSAMHTGSAADPAPPLVMSGTGPALMPA